MKNSVFEVFKNILQSLPYFLLGVFLFFTVSFFFGFENFLLATIFLLLSKKMVNSFLSKYNYFKYGLFLILIGIMAFLATINIFLAVIINFITLFFLIFVYSDEFTPMNHFLLGLEFVLLQVASVSFSGLFIRIMAIIYCYSMMLIFIFIIRKIKIKGQNEYVVKSYAWLIDNLKKIKRRNTENINVSEIYKFTSDYCLEIHENVIDQGGVLNEGERFDFYFLLHAEQIAQLLYDVSKHPLKLNKKDYRYFSKLAKILNDYDDYNKLGNNIKSFINHYNLTDSYFNEDFFLVLNSLVKILENRERNTNKNTYLTKPFSLRFKYLKNRFSFNDQGFRFAFQSALLVSFSFLISFIIPIMESGWIATAAYSTISLYPDDTFKNTCKRILGMFLGFVFFVIITRYIPSSIVFILVLFAGYIVMISVESKLVKTMMGTQLSIISVYPYLGLTLSFILRLTLVMFGFIIVIFGTRFIVKTRKKEAFEIKLKELINKNRDLIFELSNVFKNKNPYNTGAMMMMHLIINDLYKLKENQNIIREENIDKLLNYNYRFITDINRGAMVFYQNDISLEEKEFLRKEIYLIDKVAKGKFNIKNMPKSIYQIKHNTNNYLEFQIEKSRFTIGKFMRELERSKD